MIVVSSVRQKNKSLIHQQIFGRDENAQMSDRFWLYAGFSLLFVLLILGVSLIKSN